MNFSRIFLHCFFVLLCSATILAQPVKQNFVLSVKDESLISLRAKDAPLREVIAGIAEKIHIPITLSDKLKNERLTVHFSNLPWQEALRELAPQSYADFVLSGGLNQSPQCLGIFLLDHAEKQPPQNSNVKASSQAFLLEGDTEATDNSKTTEVIPLQVSVTQGLLTVRARQQPLSVVLYKIAESFGVAFELRHEIPDLIDLNFDSATPLQWMSALPTTTQLYYRRNLQNTLDKPLRLLLEKPALRKSLREQLSSVRKK